MKKLSFLGAALLAASLIFTGCSNGNDSDSSSGGGGNPQSPALPDMDVSAFADCTETASSFSFAEGSEWLLQFMEKGNSSSRAAANNMDYAMEFYISVLGKADNDYDFTDGESVMIMRSSEVLGAYYSEYKNLPAADKTDFNAEFEDKMKDEMKDHVYGTVTTATLDDDYVKVYFELSTTYLDFLRSMYDFSRLPPNKTIKTHPGNTKTKYILTVPHGNGENEVFYIGKKMPQC